MISGIFIQELIIHRQGDISTKLCPVSTKLCTSSTKLCPSSTKLCNFFLRKNFLFVSISCSVAQSCAKKFLFLFVSIRCSLLTLLSDTKTCQYLNMSVIYALSAVQLKREYLFVKFVRKIC